MSNLEDFIQEKIEELSTRGDEVADQADTYFFQAKAIDAAEVGKSERPLSLDDRSYGEECARLEGRADALRKHLSDLRSLDTNNLPVAEVERRLEAVEEEIDDLEGTLHECTALPDDDDDDDDDEFYERV